MRISCNLLLPSLDKGRIDNDEIMLYACFSLLADCIENEKLLSAEMFDWKHSKKVIKEKAELQQLYKWWKQRLKKTQQSALVSPDDKQYKEDNTMLIRLIKFRHRLWT